MTFKPGDTVRCIDATGAELIEGDIYKIVRIRSDGYMVDLVPFGANTGRGFMTDRFVLVDSVSVWGIL